MGAARLKKYMDVDYTEIKAYLVELELAKKIMHSLECAELMIAACCVLATQASAWLT